MLNKRGNQKIVPASTKNIIRTTLIMQNKLKIHRGNPIEDNIRQATKREEGTENKTQEEKRDLQHSFY